MTLKVLPMASKKPIQEFTAKSMVFTQKFNHRHHTIVNYAKRHSITSTQIINQPNSRLGLG